MKSNHIIAIVITSIIISIFTISTWKNYNEVRDEIGWIVKHNLNLITKSLDGYIESLEVDKDNDILQVDKLMELKKQIYTIDQLMHISKYKLARTEYETKSVDSMWCFFYSFNDIYIENLEKAYLEDKFEDKDQNKIINDLIEVNKVLTTIKNESDNEWQGYLDNWTRIINSAIDKYPNNHIFNEYKVNFIER